MQKLIKYLGHVLDDYGLRPDPDKVEAILKAPQLQNRDQLESFLGILQYYGRHVPKLRTLSSWHNERWSEEVGFTCTIKQQSAFENLSVTICKHLQYILKSINTTNTSWVVNLLSTETTYLLCVLSIPSKLFQLQRQFEFNDGLYF